MVSAVLEGDFKQISSFQNKGPFSMDERKTDSSKRRKDASLMSLGRMIDPR